MYNPIKRINRKGMKKGLYGIFVLFLMVSCIDKNIVFEDDTTIEGKEWTRDKKLVFNVEIEDTTKKYLVSCFVRNHNDYEFTNLYINYALQDSSKKQLKSSLKDLLLYDPQTGNPLGKTEFFSNSQTGVYALDTVKFSKSGKYIFSLQHQMREIESVEKIQGIGLQLKAL
jgi:gliding motility-associated lipoprotein GldH